MGTLCRICASGIRLAEALGAPEAQASPRRTAAPEEASNGSEVAQQRGQASEDQQEAEEDSDWSSEALSALRMGLEYDATLGIGVMPPSGLMADDVEEAWNAIDMAAEDKLSAEAFSADGMHWQARADPDWMAPVRVSEGPGGARTSRMAIAGEGETPSQQGMWSVVNACRNRPSRPRAPLAPFLAPENPSVGDRGEGEVPQQSGSLYSGSHQATAGEEAQ